MCTRKMTCSNSREGEGEGDGGGERVRGEREIYQMISAFEIFKAT